MIIRVRSSKCASIAASDRAPANRATWWLQASASGRRIRVPKIRTDVAFDAELSLESGTYVLGCLENGDAIRELLEVLPDGEVAGSTASEFVRDDRPNRTQVKTRLNAAGMEWVASRAPTKRQGRGDFVASLVERAIDCGEIDGGAREQFTVSLPADLIDRIRATGASPAVAVRQVIERAALDWARIKYR